MLTAMEDLLGSWPGTPIVVSHDRYPLERVTDQQSAIHDHGLRHVHGGADDDLRLQAEQERRSSRGAGGTASGGAGSSGAAPAGTAPDGADTGGAASANGASGPKLTGAQARATKKELASIERRMDKLNSQIADKHEEMAA